MDDIIFRSFNKSFNDEFSKLMTNMFEMSMMEELKFFLGFEIKQLSEGNFISKTKLTQDILRNFKMQDAKGKRFPMDTKCHLELKPKGVDANQSIYRSMIGSLLYLCASRPGIVLTVEVCARYQAVPKDIHLYAINRILRYLVYTPRFGLWYPKGSYFSLAGYTDSDWCKDHRKSTSEACQFLGRSLVSWSSKKQNCISLNYRS